MKRSSTVDNNTFIIWSVTVTGFRKQTSRAEFFIICSISLCQKGFLAWKAAFCSVLQSPAWDLIRFRTCARAALAKKPSKREFKISSCAIKSLRAKNHPLQWQCKLTY